MKLDKVIATLISAALVVMVGASRVRAQIPGLPLPAAPAHAGAGEEKSRKTVAAATGPITIKERVTDSTIEAFLAKFLPKYPGVRTMTVVVNDGVVALQGRVDDDDTHDEITDVVRRVEGVRLVLNQLKTDEEMMTAPEFATGELNKIRDYFARKWLLVLVALGLAAISAVLARLFAAHSETLLAPFVHNVLLRAVVGSLISSMLVIGGLLLALSALKLTQAVLSILGLAGVVGLAVGFAFRDITENFIASVLLGVRRPFQIGDYVTVAGQSGVVKSLNTRATVLATLEGNHVRIPNSVIFKEILVNATASPTMRNSFDVVIPPEASTAAALAAIAGALRAQDGILAEPAPRAVVEALEPGGVRLRAYFWSPTHGVDLIQLLSDAKLKARVALQQAGVFPPPVTVVPKDAGPVVQTENGGVVNHLKRDAHAAATSSPVTGTGRESAIDHVLQEPETRVSEEGANLLQGSRAE
jgi:small-conductance mechanosensitive channel